MQVIETTGTDLHEKGGGNRLTSQEKDDNGAKREGYKHCDQE